VVVAGESNANFAAANEFSSVLMNCV